MSMFWRVLGGTLLSIAALVVITLYQQIVGSITEVRHSVEQRCQKDEFEEHKKKVWERFHEAQMNEERADEVLRDRCAHLEQQVKDAEQCRQEMVRELEWLRGTTVEALRDRSALLEQQLQISQADRQDVVRELQKLRERLAAIEGRQPPSGIQPAVHRKPVFEP